MRAAEMSHLRGLISVVTGGEQREITFTPRTKDPMNMCRQGLV